ncbi:MAG: hypothetical protein CTY14_02205 [Methylotenera sp.]|nr:MAG: hypothetical protein CTY14_02205 [Methylotenera sp.]
MSDLISKKWVTSAIMGLDYPTSKQQLIDLITNAPAIEQGEAVIDKAAYDGAREDLSIWKRRALEAEEKVRKYDQRIVDIGVIAMTPVTTPKQPQSVADALEEAAKICDDEAEGFYQRSGSLDYETNALEFSNEHAREAYDLCKELAEQIRALIKRNAKVVE